MNIRKMALLTLTLTLVITLLGLNGCGLTVKSIPAGQIASPTPQAQDHFITVGSMRYHYCEYPSTGADIVMVHGWSSSTYTWEKVAPVLQKQGYHVWTLDMKGFGWSDKPHGNGYDPYSLMQGVKAWMDAVGLKKVIYVGNSLGGGVGMILALEHPEVVDRLVLVDAAIYPHKKPFAIALAGLPGASLGGKIFFGRWMVADNLKRAYYHPDWITSEQIEAYYDRMRTAGALDALIAVVKSLNYTTLDKYAQRAAQIKARTLIVHGKNDQWVPIEDSHRFHRAMPNSIMAVVPDCGHVPQEEYPQVTAQLLLDFLNGALTRDVLLPVSAQR